LKFLNDVHDYFLDSYASLLVYTLISLSYLCSDMAYNSYEHANYEMTANI